MNYRTRAALGALAVVAVIAWIGCSKKSDGGYPNGPSTGGGGTTFNFGPFAASQSVVRTFTTAGTFGYHCNPHRSSGMTGTVQVDAGGADSVVVNIGPSNTLTFSPATAHIKPNGYVRWVNVSSMTNHTVTND